MKRFLYLFFIIILLLLHGCHSTGADTSHTAIEAKPKTVHIYDIADTVDVCDEASEYEEAPAEGALLRIAVIGDMNGSYGSKEYPEELSLAIDRIIAEKPDLVINVGDMVAGQRPKLDYEGMWAAFHSIVTDRLKEAGVLMAQVPGNHDASAYAGYEKEREIYIEEWNARKPELAYLDDSMYPLYYSFIHSGVLFLALDATTLEPLDDDQYAWLERELKKNQDELPVVVFGHVPLFPITSIKPREILRDPRLPVLFENYGVQLYITGHQHAYFPAHHNGVSYLHAGALGGGPRPLRANAGIAPKTLSFVSIYPKQKPAYETYVMDQGQRRIKLNRLPTYLKLPKTILARYDVSQEDALFAQRHWISAHLTRSQMKMLIESYKAKKLDFELIPEWELSYDVNAELEHSFVEIEENPIFNEPAYRELIR
ncbi:MAG: metallophosphoesterase [Bradymonadales bacterium]|jgi:hypothetical protein